MQIALLSIVQNGNYVFVMDDLLIFMVTILDFSYYSWWWCVGMVCHVETCFCQIPWPRKHGVTVDTKIMILPQIIVAILQFVHFMAAILDYFSNCWKFAYIIMVWHVWKCFYQIPWPRKHGVRHQYNDPTMTNTCDIKHFYFKAAILDNFGKLYSIFLVKVCTYGLSCLEMLLSDSLTQKTWC